MEGAQATDGRNGRQSLAAELIMDGVADGVGGAMGGVDGCLVRTSRGEVRIVSRVSRLDLREGVAMISGADIGLRWFTFTSTERFCFGCYIWLEHMR